MTILTQIISDLVVPSGLQLLDLSIDSRKVFDVPFSKLGVDGWACGGNVCIVHCVMADSCAGAWMLACC
jgi:hypothetical protein